MAYRVCVRVASSIVYSHGPRQTGIHSRNTIISVPSGGSGGGDSTTIFWPTKEEEEGIEINGLKCPQVETSGTIRDSTLKQQSSSLVTANRIGEMNSFTEYNNLSRLLGR